METAGWLRLINKPILAKLTGSRFSERSHPKEIRRALGGNLMLMSSLYMHLHRLTHTPKMRMCARTHTQTERQRKRAHRTCAFTWKQSVERTNSNVLSEVPSPPLRGPWDEGQVDRDPRKSVPALTKAHHRKTAPHYSPFWILTTWKQNKRTKHGETSKQSMYI